MLPRLGGLAVSALYNHKITARARILGGLRTADFESKLVSEIITQHCNGN